MKIDSSTPGVTGLQTQSQSIEQWLDQARDKDFSTVLKKTMQEKDDKKLYEACQQLEAVFLSKVMENMRATIPRNDLTGYSFAEETFESMLYDEYAKSMSKTGSLGLADIIYKQLSGKF